VSSSQLRLPQTGVRLAPNNRAWHEGAPTPSITYEFVELALGQHGVGDVEARVLPHVRQVAVQRVQQPVVARAAHLELQRAQRVRDVLDGVHQAVRVVVARVDAPLVARLGVRGELDAVRDQVVPAVMDEKRDPG